MANADPSPLRQSSEVGRVDEPFKSGEEVFIEAYVDLLVAKREEATSRQRTYDLEKITYTRSNKVTVVRNRLFGHAKGLDDLERDRLFQLIAEADKRFKDHGKV